MAAAPPLASVVVPTFNSHSAKRGSILLVLRALFRQELRPLEVIVVDDGSADATLAAVAGVAAPAHVSLRSVALPHTGNRGAVRNAGVREARSETLVFLDDDTLPLADDALSRLAGLATIGSFACGATRRWALFDWDPADMDRRLSTGDYASLAGRSLTSATMGIPAGGWRIDTSYLSNFGAVSRKDFDRVGGFDAERYRTWGMEDLDLMLRLMASGVRLQNVHASLQVLHLTHETGEPDRLRYEENLRLYRERERELGFTNEVERVFGSP